jgi:spore coat polysaccharide biosynthesis protein SpsF
VRHIAIVLARLDSSRLPRKALRQVHGTPLVGYALERAKQIRSLAQVVLATTERSIDDPLAAYAQSAGVAVFRGATDNVAQRCVDCATLHGADFFVRLNADSPFPDPALIEAGLQAVDANPRLDLVTNLIGRTFPYGVSVEIVRVATLARVLPTLTPGEAEHVTRRFYDHEGDFVLHRMYAPDPALKQARMVVDTEGDLRAFASVARRLGARVMRASYDEVARQYLHDNEPGLPHQGT